MAASLTPPEVGRRLPARFRVAALFFLSGISGLVYEIIWLHRLSLTFGSTTWATSTVLAVFMAGLGLGSFLFGRAVERAPRNALMLFVWQQAGIAAYALASLGLLGSLTPAYAWLYGATGGSWLAASVARLIAAFIILLPPTVLMGGTLPALSQHFIRGRGGFGPTVAMLYGANTLGAGVGCAAASFVMIGAIGMRRTLAVAAVLNIVAAVGAWLSARQTANGPPPAAPERSSGHSLTPHSTPRYFLLLVAAAGFCSLATESLWVRLLSQAIGSDVQAFGAMLSTLLVGMAVGSWLLYRGQAFTREPMALFVSLAIALGLFCMLVLPLLVQLQPFFLSGLPRWIAQRPWCEVAARLGVCAAATLIPSILMGMLFPLGAALYGRAQHAGGDMGAVLACNTLGAIAGALLAGLGLLPLLGAERSAAAVAGLYVLVGAALVPSCQGLYRTRVGQLRLAALALLLALGTWLSVARTDPAALVRGAAPRDYDLIWRGEDAVAKLAVFSNRRDRRVRLMLQNGSAVALSAHEDVRELRLLAHLPMLLADAPRDALFIGFGTGITAAAAITHRVRIDCAELQRLQLAAAGLFSDLNHDVARHPLFHFHAADGRNHLLLNPKSYDVIVRDAFPPRDSPDLFSSEFYGLCRSRLSPGGMVAAFVYTSTYQSEERFRSTVGAFVRAFPHASMWYGGPGALFLLGHDRPLKIRLPALLQRMAEPAVRADLAEVEMDDLAVILSHFLAAGEPLRKYVERAPIVTDDRPWGYLLRQRTSRQARARIHASLMQLRRPVANWLQHPSRGSRAATAALAHLRDAFRATTLLMQANYRAQTADRQAAEQFYTRALDTLPSYRRARRDGANNLVAIAKEALAHAQLEKGLKLARQAIARCPTLAAAHQLLGSAFDAMRQPGQATPEYRRALELNPYLTFPRGRLKALTPR